MDSRSLVGEFLSPESTVTSLMSNTGRLRSSLLPPEHNSSIRYRNKDYDSASAALDAYIADFESSCQNCRFSAGGLVLPHSPLSTPSRPRVSTLRNKDVLRESLTERELDFLNLPVSSLHHGANRDRLSMTTDELLSIPNDGTMPVTHTSAFIQGLVSQSGASQLHGSSSTSGPGNWAGLSSSFTKPQLSHHHPQLTRNSRCRGRGAATFKTHDNKFPSAHRAAGSEFTEPSSFHPHWFTSSRADREPSGSSSIPDLNYPAWVQGCDRSESQPQLPPTEPKLWDDHSFPAAVRTRAPSWVAELEEDDLDQTRSQVGDLRLQLAEQISLLAAERKSSDIMDTHMMFRDNRIEYLIQKADHVLNSLCQSCDGADKPAVSPVNTEELLSSSSRCPSLTLDPAAAPGGGTEALSDRGAETLSSGLHGNNIWKQPGPVEALKQMLFRLQAVETKLQRQEEEASESQTHPDRPQTPGTQTTEVELESFSGGPSLHRALHHLSRLKLLVDEPREEEKDEDEGRYSSSSADGLICTQLKLS
ncbi:lung adenoma susceptibility protein 2 [Hippoglossus hippoglossus]|uniref:lung adenoma susceptibility protein 2 n=1 Tax=Hippoglossus hippoglossus TaxID=8267 RepID=UPI00148CC06A|nr:lung adenoma susceptibility protein 2 [Hippoglossus hippoglossus]